MTLIYIAHPIDRANPKIRTLVSGALAALGGGRGHLEGNHLYIPSAAFKIGPGCPTDTTINSINAMALHQAGALLALWPRDAKSWGVPIEVDRAVQEGKRTALVVEDDPTWAMVYAHDGVEVFKVDPREHDGFTMATLRAMDWLTGHKREERKILIDGGIMTPNVFYKTPAETAETITRATLDRAQFGRNLVHPMFQAGGVPTEAQFLGNAGSETAPEAPGRPGTDEKPEEAPEGHGDPIEGSGDDQEEEGPVEIGFRDLQYGHDADALVKLPTRGYASDAGLDIHVSEDTTIDPGTFADIRSHVAVNLPQNTWAYLVGRSSTLRKKGLLVNPGVIDNGYTGELYSAVWNLTRDPVKVHAGERIAQLILMPNLTPAYQPVWTTEKELSERGAQGFGSSGV